MASKQKTARFAAVVAQAGRPRVHLTFLAAAKDPELQSAIKAHRVMSVVSFNTGTKKDYGVVGYVEELASQILIFPKSLKAFDGRRIVGINYDLLAEETAAPARKIRTQAVKGGKKPSPAPERQAIPDPGKALAKLARAQKKAQKPPRLTLRRKLESVLDEWENGDQSEARSALRTVISSLQGNRADGRRGKTGKRHARG